MTGGDPSKATSPTFKVWDSKARNLKGDLNMSRADREVLERIAFDMAMASMEYNGEAEEVWRQTQEASDEDLLAYITEE
jgi:hypothetical protein